jgi:phosphate butyryltransferase
VGFDNFDDMVCEAQNREKKKRFVIVAAESRRTLEPVMSACEDGIVEPILIGNRQVIQNCIEEISGKLREVTIIPSASPEESAQIAADLVNEGTADCLMKGHMETSTFMRVLLRSDNKLRTGEIMSALTLLQLPYYHKILSCSDGGINLFPDLRQKKLIIENGVAGLRGIGIRCPKVAVMAAVGTVYPKIPATVDADNLAGMNQRGEIKDCIVEGPLSYDLAISQEAARIKGLKSAVAGDADFLLWPDINCANLITKALIYVPGTRTATVVFGAKIPIIITSRAASFEEKYLSMAFAAL